jgi:iron complex outermembrane receptor protein
VLRGYLANAEKVRSQGFDGTSRLRPSERFNVYVNASYTDATYRKFVDAPCPPELSGGGSRTPVICARRTSATARPTATFPASACRACRNGRFSYGAEVNAPVTLLGREGEAYLGVDGNYRSGFSSNPSPSIYTWVDGYALTNLRAGFRTDAGFDIYGWVRNAFGVDYFEQLRALGQHRPDRRPAGRSSDLGTYCQD